MNYVERCQSLVSVVGGVVVVAMVVEWWLLVHTYAKYRQVH